MCLRDFAGRRSVKKRAPKNGGERHRVMLTLSKEEYLSLVRLAQAAHLRPATYARLTLFPPSER